MITTICLETLNAFLSQLDGEKLKEIAEAFGWDEADYVHEVEEHGADYSILDYAADYLRENIVTTDDLLRAREMNETPTMYGSGTPKSLSLS